MSAQTFTEPRQPIYHETSASLRIASKPNGRWQAQACHGKGTKTIDPWVPLFRETDFASAKAQMNLAAKKAA